MILRFSPDLAELAIYAHGSELAEVMGKDKDGAGKRTYTWPDAEEQHVVTFENPVLVTDNHRIAGLEPSLRDTIFALFGKSVKVTEYDGTSLRFEQRLYPGVWGPSIDTLLFCKGLRALDLSKVKTAVEIGCGSGYISKYVAQHAPQLESLTIADINPKAIECAMQQQFPMQPMFVMGDGIKHIQGKKFDLVLCNPPYIPRPRSIDDNPYEGISLLHYLLSYASDHLTEGGRLVTNISSLCAEQAAHAVAESGVKVRELATLEVPLKVYNVLNNPLWMEYLLDKGLKKEKKYGHDYWQRIRIVEVTASNSLPISDVPPPHPR